MLSCPRLVVDQQKFRKERGGRLVSHMVGVRVREIRAVVGATAHESLNLSTVPCLPLPTTSSLSLPSSGFVTCRWPIPTQIAVNLEPRFPVFPFLLSLIPRVDRHAFLVAQCFTEVQDLLDIGSVAMAFVSVPFYASFLYFPTFFYCFGCMQVFNCFQILLQCDLQQSARDCSVKSTCASAFSFTSRAACPTSVVACGIGSVTSSPHCKSRRASETPPSKARAVVFCTTLGLDYSHFHSVDIAKDLDLFVCLSTLICFSCVVLMRSCPPFPIPTVSSFPNPPKFGH